MKFAIGSLHTYIHTHTHTHTQDLAAWAALPDTQREEILSRHRDNERHVTSSLLLMNETIHMVMYLTSDETIRRPFLAPTLCGRLANMLLSIISKLVGTKGLEIKVENPGRCACVCVCVCVCVYDNSVKTRRPQ